MQGDIVALGQIHPPLASKAPCAGVPGACASRARITVELIGPPGSGKTTLARAVAAEVALQGMAVRLAISARPGEQARGTARMSGLAKLASALSGVTRSDVVAQGLMDLLPLAFWPTALRRRRYIAGLAMATVGDGVVVQDQGYLCAIAGLMLDSGRIDSAVLASALGLVPIPDVAVRVTVPDAVSGARLGQRQARQGLAARLLERPAADNRRLDEVFAMIDTQLRMQGCPVIVASGQDQSGLVAAVAQITQAVRAFYAPQQGEATRP